MNNPINTYRIQFNKDFTFDDLEKQLPYLHKLGIKTIYASPIFKATPGSTHGYDGTNPTQINPEIGTEQQLLKISKKLKDLNMLWVQDIVPNHMAFHPDNEWLMDVLEKGEKSFFCSFFDTGIQSSFLKGKLMVPFLGKPVYEVVKDEELTIVIKHKNLYFNYFDNHYPLNPSSYEIVFDAIKNPPRNFEILKTNISNLNRIEDNKTFAGNWETAKNIFFNSLENKEVVLLNHHLKDLSANQPLIKSVLNNQYYELCFWEETNKRITFRRFFTVNGLISLNIQNQEVFNFTHSLIKKLIEQQVFNGLRIDHIDGLYNPEEYLHRLRLLAGEETYIIAEKILEEGEEIPKHWPLQGNTGYDFLALVNNLLSNNNAEDEFSAFYKQFAGINKYESNLEVQARQKKANILHDYMAGDLDNLYQLFLKLKLNTNLTYNFNKEQIKAAIGLFLIYCPVYRYYGDSFPLDEIEYEQVKSIFEEIKKVEKELLQAVEMLQNCVLTKPQSINDEDYRKRAIQFYQRCMQFTGPVMAKGIEDTLMFTYNRFVGHNEVGDHPSEFGITIKNFHKQMVYRQQNWPLTLNATSTHDTKKGEGVRARLNALTFVKDTWFKEVLGWQTINKKHKENNLPDTNDEYFIYQYLVAAYPMPGDTSADFIERFCAFLEKSLREGKVNSNWTKPNENYENATKNFIINILNDEDFMKLFSSFHLLITDLGIINSLSQLVLKFTCPGVPDIYRGCELWDLSLVDPDNRRPVDYNLRSGFLSELKMNQFISLNTLWKDRFNGKIKLWLTQQLLAIRNENVAIFTKGEYLPIATAGKFKNDVISFAKVYKNQYLIFAIPVGLNCFLNSAGENLAHTNWEDTRLILPKQFISIKKAINLFTKQYIEIEQEILLNTNFYLKMLFVVSIKKDDN